MIGGCPFVQLCPRKGTDRGRRDLEMNLTRPLEKWKAATAFDSVFEKELRDFVSLRITFGVELEG